MENKCPKDCTCKKCKAEKENPVKESVALTGFIKCITEKNFAKANKYLQSACREKIKSKIRQCANQKPF